MNRLVPVLPFVLVLVLVACSPGQTGSSSNPGSGFPVTMTHKFGSTTLNQPPIRVVTVGLVDQDAFVALGVVPVATREWYGKVPGALFPWAKEKIGAAALPEVLTYELDFEKIAALKPDVIVGLYSGLTQEEYDTLSKIAPTVAQPADRPDWSADWRLITAAVGSILGKKAEADALVAGLEQRFADEKAKHPETADRTMVLLSDYGWPDTFYAYSYHGGALRFVTDLGYKPLENIVALTGPKTGIALSREQFRTVDADLVMWTLRGADAQKAINADPVWKKLKAAQEERVLYFRTGQGEPYDALVFASVLSLQWAFDGLAGQLLQASAPRGGL